MPDFATSVTSLGMRPPQGTAVEEDRNNNQQMKNLFFMHRYRSYENNRQRATNMSAYSI